MGRIAISAMSSTVEKRAFELFLAESRKLHEERHPGAKIDENLFKKLAQDKWRQATMNEKHKFLEKSASPSAAGALLTDSAFVKFSKSKRSEIRAQNPGVSAMDCVS